MVEINNVLGRKVGVKIGIGLDLPDALVSLGIDPTPIIYWDNLRKDNPNKFQMDATDGIKGFFLEIDKARIDLEERLLGFITEEAEGTTVIETETTTYPSGKIMTIQTEKVRKDWKAGTFLLEKLFPNKFGKGKTDGEVGNSSGAVTVRFELLTPESVKEELEGGLNEGS